MTKDEIKRDVHYQPAGYTTVCGFIRTVHEALQRSDVDNLPHPVLLVRTTTNVRKVTCVACANWLRDAADLLPRSD